MSTDRHFLVGIENAALDGSLTAGGLGGAVASAPDKGADRAIDGSTHTRWRSADSAPANTRILETLDRPRDIGAVHISAGEWSVWGQARVRCDSRWVEKAAVITPGASSGSGLTVSNLDHPSSWRLELLISILDFPASGETAVARMTDSLVSTSDSDHAWRLDLDPSTGSLRWRIHEYAAGGLELSAPAVSPGSGWHLVILKVDAGSASLIVDGTEVDTGTAPAHSASSVAFLAVGEYCSTAVGLTRLYDSATAVTDDSKARAGFIGTGREKRLVLDWALDEGSGVTTADRSPNGNDATITGSSWGQAPNIDCAYDSGIEPLVQRWAERDVVAFAGGGYLETGATLSAPRSTTVSMWIRAPGDLDPSVFRTVAWRGTSYDPADWWAFFTAGTTFRVNIKRGAVGSPLQLSATGLADGEWHYVYWTIDGWSNSARLVVDGVEADSGTAPAWSSPGSERLRIGADASIGTTSLVGDISGDVTVWDRVVGDSEMETYRLGRAEPGADPSIVHQYRVDGAAPFTDYGTAGADLTLSGAVTYSTRRSGTTPQLAAQGRYAHPSAAWPIYPTVAGAREILVEIFDEESSSIAVGLLGAWEVIRPTRGRTPGGRGRYVKPKHNWSQGGAAYRQPGATRRRLRVDLVLASEEEVRAIETMADRELSELLVLSIPDESIFQPDNAIYGIITDSGECRDRQLRLRAAYARSIDIMEVL